MSAEATGYKSGGGKMNQAEGAIIAGIEDESITLKTSTESLCRSMSKNDRRKDDDESRNSATTNVIDASSIQDKNDIKIESVQLNSDQLSSIHIAFRRNQLFHTLEEEIIDVLSMKVIPLAVKKNTVVIRQGENGKFIYFD